MTVNEAYYWLYSAKHGDRVVYHRGALADDRDRGEKTKRAELNFLADTFWEAARTRRVALMQKKLGIGRYEYIAVRTKDRVAPR